MVKTRPRTKLTKERATARAGKRRQVDQKQKGPQLEPHQVILRPLVTEKGTFQSQHFNQYVFEVNALATKQDIKNAVETLFHVRVDKVATQMRRGKQRRFRFRTGRTCDWKRAIVKLHSEHRIDFF